MKTTVLYLYTISLLFNSIFCSFQQSIFVETNKQFEGKNLVISPLSLYQALSLATNGAKSSTQKEMLKVLQSTDISELNEINFDILEIFKDFSTVEIANAVMIREFTPVEDFTAIAKQYLAPTCELKSADQVNSWCEEKTHGKITKIIDKLNDDIVMVILNAVYFKGKWADEFNKSSTNKKPFYNFGLEENEIMVDMMKQEDHFNYYEGNGIQAIELAYKQDSMSAVIILPPKNTDINEFIATSDLSEIISKLSSELVNLQLPKFEIDFTVKLNDILKALGMKTAFSDTDADFTGIKEKDIYNLYIDFVIQKAYIKVDEEGTEAAAVTIIGGAFGGAIPNFKLPVYMVVNRPFLFLIRNKKFPKGQDLLFITKIEELK